MSSDRLPDWAEVTGENRHGMPIVEVDTHEAYPVLLDEYRAHYAENVPGEWEKADGELRKEWAECLESLNSEEPSAYWLEVVYQTAKLDIVVGMRGFGTENRFHDSGKRYAQAARSPGRGPEKAAGGISGGKEAREHYKRLRGFLPV